MPLPGPSKLSIILAKLNQKPALKLVNVKSLKLTLAAKNDHFGARHFMSEELPRIRWANPNIAIEVQKAVKTPYDVWRPELEVVYEDGKQDTLNLHGKWSTTIVRLLMDRTGHADWKRWVSDAQTQGTAILPGDELESRYIKSNLSKGVSATTLGVDGDTAWTPPSADQPPPLAQRTKRTDAQVEAMTSSKQQKKTGLKALPDTRTEAQRAEADAQRLQAQAKRQALLDLVTAEEAAKQAEVDRILAEMEHTSKRGASAVLP